MFGQLSTSMDKAIIIHQRNARLRVQVIDPFKSSPERSTIPFKAINRIDNVSYDIVCGYVKSIQKRIKLSIPTIVIHLILLYTFVGKAMPNIHNALLCVNGDEDKYKILQQLMVILRSQSWDKEVIECFDEYFIEWIWSKLQSNYNISHTDNIKVLLLIITSLQKNQGPNILSTIRPQQLLWAILNKYITNTIIKKCILLIFSRMIAYDRQTQLWFHAIQKNQNISVYDVFLNETTAINDFDECRQQNLQSICHLMKYISRNHNNTMRVSYFKITLAIIINTINILHNNNINESLFTNILLNIIDIIEMITDGGYDSLTYTFIHELRAKQLLQVYMKLTITARSSNIRYESIKYIYHVLSHQSEHKKSQIIKYLLEAGAFDYIVEVMTQDVLRYEEVANIYYYYELQDEPEFDCEDLKQGEFARVLSIILTLFESKQLKQINDKMMNIIIQQIQNTDYLYPNVDLALTCIEELLEQESFRNLLLRYKITDIINLVITKMDEHNRSTANRITEKMSMN